MSENVTDNGLTSKQQAAIRALLETSSPAAAAGQIGVTPRTVYRWLKEPAFVSALRAAEGEALRGLSRRLAGLGNAAADALRDALKEDQPMAVRLRAAEQVLTRGPALVELTDILARIEALEVHHGKNSN